MNVDVKMKNSPRPNLEKHTVRRTFIDGLRLDCSIGIFPYEREIAQPIEIDVELAVIDPKEDEANADSIIRYDLLVKKIERTVCAGHIDFVETITERIADLCDQFVGVSYVSVRVRKLQAIPNARSVGVTIERKYGHNHVDPCDQSRHDG